MFEDIFQNQQLKKSKLIEYGFSLAGEDYVLATDILEGQFHLDVVIDRQEKVSTRLTDNDIGEEYTLHLSESVSGVFVGKIRTEIENILQQIAEHCFETAVFKHPCTRQIINYVQEKYGDDLEFLWEKLPNAAIWRRKDTKKWYAVLMTIAKSKLGLKEAGEVEVINVHASPEEVDTLVDNQKYFAGYHMNKKHWLTIILDYSVPLPEIYHRIDTSYELAKKK